MYSSEDISNMKLIAVIRDKLVGLVPEFMPHRITLVASSFHPHQHFYTSSYWNLFTSICILGILTNQSMCGILISVWNILSLTLTLTQL